MKVAMKSSIKPTRPIRNPCNLTHTLSRGGEAIASLALATIAPRHIQTGCVLLANWTVLAFIDV